MAIGPVLELNTLPTRHPIGEALLDLCGPHVIIRLSIDPVQHPGALQREVLVERSSPATGGKPHEEVRAIGWAGLPGLSTDYLARVRIALPANDITAYAAIGVMALLIHELEGGILEAVLPIGSGGDYLVVIATNNRPLQVEVSGIRQDLTGTEAKSRLVEKCSQVLTKSPAGFASVTTFCWKDAREVHSYLHFVEEHWDRKQTRRKANKRGKRS